MGNTCINYYELVTVFAAALILLVTVSALLKLKPKTVLFLSANSAAGVVIYVAFAINTAGAAVNMLNVFLCGIGGIFAAAVILIIKLF